MTTKLQTRFLRAHLRADEAKDGGPLHFVASTANVARDGLVIDPEAWELDNYRKNPVVLWAHDYGGGFMKSSRTLPIGRTEELTVDGDELHSDIQFDLDDDFAAAIDRKYRNGFLHAVSVGWDTHEIVHSDDPAVAPKVTRAELLDISAVSVPGDADALIQRQLRGLVEAGLILPEQIAPFAGIGTREGAVLSKRNRDDLERAADLIKQVLDRAAKEADGDEDDDEESDEDRTVREFLEGIDRKLATLGSPENGE